MRWTGKEHRQQRATPGSQVTTAQCQVAWGPSEPSVPHTEEEQDTAGSLCPGDLPLHTVPTTEGFQEEGGWFSARTTHTGH